MPHLNTPELDTNISFVGKRCVPQHFQTVERFEASGCINRFRRLSRLPKSPQDKSKFVCLLAIHLFSRAPYFTNMAEDNIMSTINAFLAWLNKNSFRISPKMLLDGFEERRSRP